MQHRLSADTEPAMQNNVRVPVFGFIKKEGYWYIALPDSLNPDSPKAQLELLEGLDEILSLVARKKKQVYLSMDTAPFEGADLLELHELCEAPTGGGYYIMRTCGGKSINRKLWLCDLTLLIFGDMPQQIFIRKEPEMERSSQFSAFQSSASLTT